MKSLDELIPDEGVLMFHKTPAYLFPDQITGVELKAAIRAEIAERIKEMRDNLCVQDHDWEYNYSSRRCKHCGKGERQ